MEIMKVAITETHLIVVYPNGEIFTMHTKDRAQHLHNIVGMVADYCNVAHVERGTQVDMEV